MLPPVSLRKSGFLWAQGFRRNHATNREQGVANSRRLIQGVFMAGSRSTFGKRQKERARQEKQAEKAQKKAQRKLEQAQTPPQRKDLVVTYNEEGQPEGFNFHDF